MQNYLDDLNPVQREAVTSTNGPALVIAGAGSGKTRVLTYRIAHLLQQGVHPSGILALTFTNKAAKEMKERIAKIVGYNTAKYLWMGTFHSIFARILRQEAKALQYESNFTIYDTQDSKNLLKTIIKELKLDPQVYKLNSVLGRISGAKNNLITANAYKANHQLQSTDRAARMPEIAHIYKIYAQRCFHSKAMDFDDLLLNTNILFRDHENILAAYQKRFSHILVDEYQDTNFSQYIIIKKLSARHRNVCVVGDDAQSIYSFRGAKIENILNFRNDYPDYKVFKLEQNYRSTQNIVNAAKSVIAKNINQLEKDVFSEKDHGQKVRIVETMSDKEEGYHVADQINTLRYSNHFAYSDFAVLYRTNAQSRILEESLRKQNIPYRIYGGLSFYQRKEIKDLLAYLRLVVNPSDNEAFKRIVNYPKRGIGEATVSKIEYYAAQHSLSIWGALGQIKQIPDKVAGRTQNAIMEFARLIMSFQEKLGSENAYDLAYEIAANIGLLRELRNDKSPEGLSRYENIQELLNGIQEYVTNSGDNEEEPTLGNYLQNVSLLTGDEKENADDREKVSLMTIHSSKGLEFRNVFLVGLEEELFPSQMTSKSLKELEEERRLFYVAITRAEENLIISYAKARYKWGKIGFSNPSRFLAEIDSNFVEWEQGTMPYASDQGIEQMRQSNPFRKQAKTPKAVDSSYKPTSHKGLSKVKESGFVGNNNTENVPKPASIGKIKVGASVMHQKFGKGKVLELEGAMPNAKATIEFDSAGIKKLLLKFARLSVLD